jgi:hypothetical protein
MNYALYFQGGALQWRFPLAFQLVFPIVVTIGLFFVPESPRWLLLRDRHEEALEVIARLQGKDVDIHNEDVTSEFLSIQAALQMERKDPVSFKDMILVRDKTQNLRRLLLSCGTQFMQQFSGVNALGKPSYCLDRRTWPLTSYRFTRLLSSYSTPSECRTRSTSKPSLDCNQRNELPRRSFLLLAYYRSIRSPEVGCPNGVP